MIRFPSQAYTARHGQYREGLDLLLSLLPFSPLLLLFQKKKKYIKLCICVFVSLPFLIYCGPFCHFPFSFESTFYISYNSHTGITPASYGYMLVFKVQSLWQFPPILCYYKECCKNWSFAYFFYIFVCIFELCCWGKVKWLSNSARYCQVLLHTSYTLLHFLQQCRRMPISPHSCQQTMLSLGSLPGWKVRKSISL